MNHPRRLIAAALLLLAANASASPAEAERLRKSWELEMEKWSLETRAATTPEARASALARQPDSVPYARKMWQMISPALDQPWTLEPAAWFLSIAPRLFTTDEGGNRVQVFSAEIAELLKALDSHHIRAQGLTPVCMALAALGDPRVLPLLEKIQSSNPDPKTQGVAALAYAIVLKSLGDGPDLMRKRLTALRKAIIDSSDVDLGGGTTVAKVAEDELYIIRHLTKGRTAPDLSGIDSASRPLKLSDHTGNIIVLFFWSSTMTEAEHAISLLNETNTRFRDRGVVVLGVNQDPLEKLRSMEADGSVSWKSFSDPNNQLAGEYRVTNRPLIFVLDAERRIQYVGLPGSFADLTVEALLSEAKPDASE